MKKRILSLVIPLATVFAFALPAQAGEHVSLEQVPAPVKETIREHVKDGKITEIEIELEQHKDKPT